ncbi:tyrosine-type recombinase/integrase [Noviherbaspirillum denitrificans]|uniref:Integrase n=1 Tax=Noviherbaspirillum denitrificans TaxID=1968433 RepID=A0A254TEV5_9BURK|nr:site-specific integrase [Noviherbaspirillum denitrificans]OWW21134.1 hypothetical protein AYR66_18300 [Noviherbaspirillum denitrificans]
MRLIHSTDEFQLSQQPYPDIPILLDRNGAIVVPALQFLIHQCLHRGRVRSAATWTAYGEALYDYFGYLEGAGHAWEQRQKAGIPSILARYRDWALKRNKESTVNFRLRLVVRFYRWARDRGLIGELPFDDEAVVRRAGGGMLVHAQRLTSTTSPDILLKQRRDVFPVLSKGQVAEVLHAVAGNPTHYLIVLLGLQTGLRRMELATFPEHYVMNGGMAGPDRRVFPVLLDPAHVQIKGRQKRTIHLTRHLLDQLWQYRHTYRPMLARRHGGAEPATLFLTADGRPFTNGGMGKIFEAISRRVGYKVHCHMLRHTYATHTLHALRSAMNIGNALLYLRERMGHSHISTTEKYLHYLEQIEDGVLNDYQREVDQLFAGGVTP